MPSSNKNGQGRNNPNPNNNDLSTKTAVQKKVGVIVILAAVFVLGFAIIFFFTGTKDSKTTKKNVPQMTTQQSVIEVSASQIEYGEKSGPEGQVYSTISIPETDLTIQEEGFPQLPVIKKIIEIPSQAESIEFEISQKGVTTTSVDHIIYPSPYKVASQTEEGFDYIEDEFFLDESVYQSSTFIPLQSAEIVKDDYFRSKRTLELNVYPVRYNPVQKMIELTNVVEVKITYHINPAASKPEDTTKFFKQLNKKESSDKAAGASAGSTMALWNIPTAHAAGSVTHLSGSQLVDSSNAIDYLIITHADFYNSSELSSLATYRANYDSFLVGVASIEDIITQFPNASGSDYSMQDFITYAYHNWQTPPSFLLLVGDSEWVPTHSVEWALGIYDDDDFFTYGADEDTEFDYDTANLAVGRLPVTSSAQIAIIKNKIEYYEQSEIISGDYHGQASYMVGRDVSGLFVANKFTDKGFDETDLHGPCPDEFCCNDVCSAFHANFVVLTAHGNTSNVGLNYCCDPGNIFAYNITFWCTNPMPADCSMPGDLVECGCCTSDTTPQWNTGAVPIVMAKSCSTAQIRDGVSLAERLVKEEAKGAVAYYGASSLAEDWNLIIAAALDEMFDNFNYQLGPAILLAEISKLTDHHQLNLIGDPALHAFGHRVNNTQSELTIGSNDFSFDSGTDTLTVTVTNLGGAAASNVPVDVLLYEADGTVHPFTSLTIPAISAYSEATANVQAVPPLRGEYRVVVKVDPNSTIAESFELNNQAASTIDTNVYTLVTVQDELEQPLSDIFVMVYDSNDMVLEVASTDSEGKALFYLDEGIQVYFRATLQDAISRSHLYSDIAMTPTPVIIQQPQPSHLTVIYPDEDIVNYSVLVYDIDNRELGLGFNFSNAYDFFIEEDTQFYYQIFNIMTAYFTQLPDIFSDTQIAPANTAVNIEVPNQPPIANAGPDQSSVVFQSVSFDGSGSSDSDGTIVSYMWDFGDGNTANGISTTHSYSVVGTYTVTLTVTDDEGATDTDTTTIAINESNQPPVLDAIGDKVVDEGVLLEFSVTASDSDGDSLIYSAANLPTGAAFSNQIFLWTPGSTQVGDHQVTFTVEDSKGGSDSETITITVQDIGLVCGDGYCAGSADGEDCISCSQDCISGQGGLCSACWKGKCDGSCNPKKETLECADCAPSYCCGDGTCEGAENVSNCQIDCGCSNDAMCNDNQSCTTDVCDAGACQNSWPSCGVSDGCCGSTCSYLVDPDCQNCGVCFKGICDGSCHPRKEGLDCPDCQV